MIRRGPWLTRGIAIAAVLLCGGRLSDPCLSHTARALDVIHGYDYTPLFGLAGNRIQDYFHSMHEEEFLDELFSLSGKWKAMTRGRESYERFVRRSFEKHLFNAHEFTLVLDKIRADYAFAADSAENRLLVVLYEDVRAGRAAVTFDKIRSEYRALAATEAPFVLKDMGMNVVSMAGSEVASILVVSALTSAGILGGSAAAGASAGVWSFGIGLVVGVVAGVALDCWVGDAYEDAARMEVRRHLNALRRRMIDTVYVALARAVDAQRRLQERCVQGGRHEYVARHR